MASHNVVGSSSVVSTPSTPKPRTAPGYILRRFHSFKKKVLNGVQCGDFEIDHETLNILVKNKDQAKLETFGGPDGLISALQSNKHDGISDKEAKARRKKFGSNTYTKTKSLTDFVMETFKKIKTLILLGYATLTLCRGIKNHGLKQGWYDGGMILLAVFLSEAVSAFINYKQNKQLDKLAKVSSEIKIDVLRSGYRLEISISDVVVGDIVFLKIGDQVPADGVLVEGHFLHVLDESSNTFLFSGTKVADGFGKMVVTSVGMNTACGEMMMSRSIPCDTNEKSQLQSRLNKIAYRTSYLGVIVFFLVLLFRCLTRATSKDENGEVIEAAALTIIAVVIPDGSPLSLTMAWVYSIKRMMGDQAMLRNLSACEKMGYATTICTDKTGTLTLNQMKVTDSWFGLESRKASSFVSRKVVELLHQGVAMNTTGSVFKADSYEFSGSPTEKAILRWAVEEFKMMDMEEIIGKHDVVHVEAFDSEKKRSGVLMKKKGEITEKNVVHWKGAAEKILAMCSTFYDASGDVKKIDEDEKIRFEKIIESMAAKSLRCIAFAYSEEDEDDEMMKNKLREENLSLLGIVGINDPCRQNVKKYVEDCQFAGLNIKMITGDNIFMAKALAVECGILTPEDEEAVLEGEKFRSYTQEERLEKVERIKVMARASPSDKLLMVECLKKLKLGHVVMAVMKDAPAALKEADIGLSMGIQGTEVAKESSDIVILDDSFASVAKVLKHVRCVRENIQKFIQFQLTVNVTALVINLVSAVAGKKVPLTAVQSLWVNLIMDTLGALALVTEKPTDDLMRKKPIGKDEPLLTNKMWRNILVQAFYQISVFLVLQFGGRTFLDVTEEVENTLIFNTFVLCQVFNMFNARSMEKKNVFKGIFENRFFVGVLVMTVVLQVLMVEFLMRLVGTERLNWNQWGVCVGIAAASWPVGWLAKLVPVPVDN